MGACFITETFDGKLSEKELEKRYNERVDQLTYEHGTDAYNGTFSTLSGIRIETRVFDSRESAEEHLSKRCQKWEHAIAVKFKDRRAAVTKQPTFSLDGVKQQNVNHHIGPNPDMSVTGLCLGRLLCIGSVRQPPAYDNVLLLADQLTEAQKNRLRRAYETWHVRHRAAVALKQDFDKLTQSLMHCPDIKITTAALTRIKTLGNRRARYNKAAIDAAQKLLTMDQKFGEKLYSSAFVDHGTHWLVGGWCAE